MRYTVERTNGEHKFFNGVSVRVDDQNNLFVYNDFEELVALFKNDEWAIVHGEDS